MTTSKKTPEATCYELPDDLVQEIEGYIRQGEAAQGQARQLVSTSLRGYMAGKGINPNGHAIQYDKGKLILTEPPSKPEA